MRPHAFYLRETGNALPFGRRSVPQDSDSFNASTNASGILSGRVDIAVSDPRDANVMYVGGEGGIWKTTNYLTSDPDGPTWLPLTDDFPSLSIFNKSLALYRDNPDILYAAANGPNGGILKTTDSGAHWQYLLSDVFSSALFITLVTHPADPNVIYVAVRGTATAGTQIAGGVYRVSFRQTGSTFVNLTANVAPGSVATDVVVDPTHPLVLYAGLVQAADPTQNGIYKSVDGGNSWQLLNNGLTTPADIGDWIALAMAPSCPETLYTTIFEAGNSSNTPELKRFLTTDAGVSWSMLNPPIPTIECQNVFQGVCEDFRSWHVVLAVDPTEPNVVYTNSHPERLFVSTDSGDTWSKLPVLQDPVNVYFDSTPTMAYVTDQGINRVLHPREPQQTSIVSKQGNLGNFLFYNIELDPRDPRSGFGVCQDHNLMPHFTGEPLWINASGGYEVWESAHRPIRPQFCVRPGARG